MPVRTQWAAPGSVPVPAATQGLCVSDWPAAPTPACMAGPASAPRTNRQSGDLSLVQTSPDTGLSLVELFYAGAKVCAITTHELIPLLVLSWHDK